ncbi:DUF1993 domain-containing protein [Mesorhizobium sp. BR1-1-16]|uniref:DUF1993 family protein n=1 Tax=Mesorhizobium sp. BR1-1-16 TaxID=2876653 RepID=UPI001CCB416B|nr:DUF1993 domain-containing protein [Mesorhizobium sp. BR1-1-16]MBZ9934823.1 DUF1993 domain-containing protein [Mesorhizobium sp. BR1-1-16]
MADLYTISVPVLIRYLRRLDGLLDRLAVFAAAEGRSEAALLALSLNEGMFDLRRQVLIAIGFSARALAPIAAALVSLPATDADNIPDLRGLVAERIAVLAALRPEDINGKEAVIVSERAGQALFETDALTFVTQYALPNFFFHLMTAFAILRVAGVPIGKADFDGFHAYPADFRFV